MLHRNAVVGAVYTMLSSPRSYLHALNLPFAGSADRHPGL